MGILARGEGRGPLAPDGCAVEVYRRFPYRGELEPLSRYLTPGSSVLELGCGTGRLTRPLLDKGCRVTAVDNSAEMLHHVADEATKVQCDIERLQLARTFDVALLASNLINTADETLRQAQLAACRRHLAPRGHLLLQRFDPAWFRDMQPGPFPSAGGVDIEVVRVARNAGLTEVSLLYTVEGEEWRHDFTAQLLEDSDVQAALEEAGFATLEWIDTKWGAACVT
jgi:SAM-dependent methyltransferase